MEKTMAISLAESLVTLNDLGVLSDAIRTQFGVDPGHVYISAEVISDEEGHSKKLTLSLEGWALIQRSGMALSDGENQITVNDLISKESFKENLKIEVTNAINIALNEEEMKKRAVSAMTEHAYECLNVPVEQRPAGIERAVESYKEHKSVVYHGPCVNFKNDAV